MIRVECFDDPRLDDYRFLRDRELSGDRRESGQFVGETLPIVVQMLAQPGLTRSVLTSQRMAERTREAIALSASKDVPQLVVDDALLEKTAGFPVNRGVLAVGVRAPLEGRAADVPPFTTGQLLLALDGVANMDNMGAMFRNAAAFGVAGVLLSRDAHDPLYRKVVRVSMGHALTIPFVQCDDLAATLRSLVASRPQLRILAADCSPDARDIATFDTRGIVDPSPHVVIIGNEFNGISQSVLAAATDRVRIPIAAGVDSLNAAVAASIILHRLALPT